MYTGIVLYYICIVIYMSGIIDSNAYSFLKKDMHILQSFYGICIIP